MTTPDPPSILISIGCTPRGSMLAAGLLHVRHVSSSEIVRPYSHWDRSEISINLSNSHAGAHRRTGKEGPCHTRSHDSTVSYRSKEAQMASWLSKLWQVINAPLSS